MHPLVFSANPERSEELKFALENDRPFLLSGKIIVTGLRKLYANMLGFGVTYNGGQLNVEKVIMAAYKAAKNMKKDGIYTVSVDFGLETPFQTTYNCSVKGLHGELTYHLEFL